MTNTDRFAIAFLLAWIGMFAAACALQLSRIVALLTTLLEKLT